jgi:hypothetical protein
LAAAEAWPSRVSQSRMVTRAWPEHATTGRLVPQGWQWLAATTRARLRYLAAQLAARVGLQAANRIGNNDLLAMRLAITA